jgi:hypothetical protein
MAQTLKFGNGTWATKEGSTLAYNDENENYKPLPFNFERDSIATRVNKEGLIEVVGKDKPRIDYTDSADGVLLLENSATNLITYSEDFSQSSWNKQSGISATYNTTETLSPDGTYNSTKLTGNGSTGIYTTASVSGVVCRSIYIKSVTGNTNVTLKDPQNTITQKTLNITPKWQRFELVEDNTTGSQGLWIDDISSLGIYIYGAQLESNASYPTSYIPTSGSSVPRAAETANGSGNSEVFNDSEGVLFADISALANDGTKRRISINNGSSTQFIQLEYRPATNTIQVGVYNGSSQGYFTELISDITLYNKIAYLYQQNNFKLYVNGFQVGQTITTGTTFSSGVLTDLSFDNGAGGDDFYGKTKEIAYYDEVLTEEELEYITSYRSLNELVTELNLNTL